MRVDRWFAFVDLSGFASFSDEHGDEESVRVLIEFRHAARKVATDFGIRIAKWLGDGCMLVAVDAAQLVAGMLELERAVDELRLPLSLHAGMAGGAVILLEGDDYTGGPVNLASRLGDLAGPHEIFATPELGELAPAGVPVELVGMLAVAGFHDPVEVVRLGCAVTRARQLP
ncbi:MAG: adenylate/guanylate cyclase domain-containing protein [Actinomycetota bacterium]|nr:adenylate/guanylate cyclase domain-containing protein [Actinomycetota bacterium]